MLLIKTNECTDCLSITELIDEINCTFLKYGNNQLINNKFEINLHVPKEDLKTLARYKSILEKRLFNPDYACEVNLGDIFSKVKLLITK